MTRKRVLAAALMAATFTGVLNIASLPASALTSDESQFVSSHNSIRSGNGLGSLSVASDLVSVARRHSARMAAAGSIWHNPNLGREVTGWQVVGENVGMGPSVPDLMDAFMNSPGHRANILDRVYRQIGVGVTVADGTIYVTVVFRQPSGSTGTVSRPRTSTRPRTTTTSRPRTAARPAAARPVAAAAPKPVLPPVRTVSMLVRMIGLDNHSY